MRSVCWEALFCEKRLFLQRIFGYEVTDALNIAIHVIVEVVHLEGHGIGSAITFFIRQPKYTYLSF
jgi:hypothetical protein